MDGALTIAKAMSRAIALSNPRAKNKTDYDFYDILEQEETV